MSATDRKLATKNLVRQKSKLAHIPAVLGDENGNIQGTIPGRVLVRRQSSNPDVLMVAEEVLAPEGKQLTWQPGDPLLLEYDNKKRLRIKGPDTDEMLAVGIDPVGASVQQNSPRVTQGSIETLSVVPGGDLVVRIKAWNVVVGRTEYDFGGADIDLATAGSGDTSVVPDSDYMCYAGLFVQDDYETVEVQVSTPRLIADAPLGKSDRQECLTASSNGSTPVFAVKLIGGQTEVTQSDLLVDGFDWRQMVNTAAATSASSAFQPDVITELVVIPANCQGNYREEVTIEDGGELVIKGRFYIE